MRHASKSFGTARRRYQIAMESCLYMTQSFLLSPMAMRAHTKTCLPKWICCCWFTPEAWIEPRSNGEPFWPTVGSPMSESYISHLNIGSLKHANDPFSSARKCVHFDIFMLSQLNKITLALGDVDIIATQHQEGKRLFIFCFSPLLLYSSPSLAPRMGRGDTSS